MWSPSARSGVSGTALWNTGIRGAPFELDSEAVALNFLYGKTFIHNYKLLELADPVPVFYGTLEEFQLHKVLRVEVVQVKSVPRIAIANDPLWYTALVFAHWELLPLDPFTQPP